MRVSMGSLQDHCPSLSPLFPWLQDALLGSPSPPTHAFSVPLPRLHTGHRPRLIRSLCLSLPFLTLCGPISTAEATRRLSSKIPHRRVPSRFPSRCFSASPGACRPLHLDLCPAPAPAPESPPQTEIRPLASKVRLGPPSSWLLRLQALDGLSAHVFPPGSLTCPALTWSRCHPLHQENGKASRIPHWPTPPLLQPEWAVQNATARRKPAHRPRAVGPGVPSSFLPPILFSTSSPQPRRPSPLGLFISLLLPATPGTELFPSFEKLLLSFQPRDLS